MIFATAVKALRYAARLSTAEKQVNDQSINLVIISETITKLIGDRLTLIGRCFLLETEPGSHVLAADSAIKKTRQETL